MSAADIGDNGLHAPSRSGAHVDDATVDPLTLSVAITQRPGLRACVAGTRRMSVVVAFVGHVDPAMPRVAGGPLEHYASA
jgi:hypothetical protein